MILDRNQSFIRRFNLLVLLIKSYLLIKDNLFECPPLFDMIQKESGASWREMYEVFNMGHRMEVYLPESLAQQLIDIAESFNVGAQIIGRVNASNEKKLTIQSADGIFKY